MNHSWTKERVRDMILGLHQSGEGLNISSIRKKYLALYMAAFRYCGSWKRAIELAGLRYSDVKAKRPTYWTSERVVAAIREFQKKHGRLNSVFVQKHCVALVGRARVRFGSWKKAVEAAGFDYSLIRMVKPRYSKRTLLAAIRRRNKAKLSLSGGTVLREDGGLYTAARRLFGKKGWDKALKETGLSSSVVNARRIWTKQKVVAEIRHLHKAGASIFEFFLQRNGQSTLTRVGRREFGSWRKAIEAAGLKYVDGRSVRTIYWTPELIILLIRRLERSGVRLNMKQMKLHKNDLVHAAQHYFGSWDEAVEAAGISYFKHCLVWSTRAWLRKLSKADVEKLETRMEILSRKRRKNK